MTLNHQCPNCLKAFCSPSKLHRHLLIHTGQKPYSCAVCLRSFTQKVHLKSHLKTASKCSLSPSSARKKSSLCKDSSIQQPSSCHNPGNSSVELELKCKISVNAEQDLKNEIRPHADIKPDRWLNISSQCSGFQEREEQFRTDKTLKHFQCELCSRSFRLEVNLVRHQTIHRSQKQLGQTSVQRSINGEVSGSESCQADATETNIAAKSTNWRELCSNYVPWQVMKSAGQWKNIHSTSKEQRNRLHPCLACCKCFPSVSKLHRHMMTHTGEKPFSCETCGKRFRQKTHLRFHCRTHLWSRYHKQRSLYINRPLSRTGGHCRTAGEETVLHAKEVGTQAYTDAVAMKHLDHISSIDIIRTNDKRGPKNEQWPHTPQSSDTLLMSEASKVTGKWRHTVKSTQPQGNMRHRCSQCLKCFPCPSKLKRHEMVHAGVKPFKCPACGKAFGQASHLKVHERSHSKTKPFLLPDSQSNMELPPNPRATGSVPAWKRFVNVDSTPSDCDGNRDVLSCTTTSVAKQLSKSNTTVATWKQSKRHRCQICSKYFQSPYKLSRHSLTHFGIRPYKCTVCSKAFTQRSHLKVHEHRCRQVRASASDCTLVDTDFSADATRVQEPSHSSREPGQGGKNESDEEQRANCCEAADCFSFPSALAIEINKLVRNQQASLSLSHVYDQNVEGQDGDVIALSDSGEHTDPVAGNQIHTDGYWCEPVIDFKCAACTESFRCTKELERHICSVNIQPKITHSAANCCDICFKTFVSPSKLTRHYLIHTGQRPFECDVCGRAFTQASHARKHRHTHSIKHA